MANDSITKTIVVAGLLCIVCSVLVSAAAVKLKPYQERNKALSTKKNILKAAGLMKPGVNVEEEFSKIKVRLVDLKTGEFDDATKPADYNQREAAKDPKRSIKIPADQDIAKIHRRAKEAPVYFVMNDGKIETIILPVHGKGLWSTMYAFLALKSDGNTVKNLVFYDEGETPGLGGEVENPRWQQQWDGKKIYDENFKLEVKVIKGKVNPNKPDAVYQADGLSGATLTTNGVNNLLRYWLSDNGFKKFLSKIRNAGVNNV